MSRLTDWLGARGLADAELVAEVPNTTMDRLSGADRVRLSALLEGERTYRQHPGDPVADWNAAQTRQQINRLLNP
jgi:hypothetical protein